MTIPELCRVDDVPATFAAVAVAAQRRGEGRLRHAASGGGGGRACMEALAGVAIDWSGVELFQVDERCVADDSPDRNARMIREVLGSRLERLAGFHEMDCDAGPGAYEEELRAAGGLDLVQLGVGPDGHTASLFPGSAALEAPAEQLVAMNSDPAGHNPHERMTLTFAALAVARLVVLTVFGADKHPVLARLADGEQLPAAMVQATRLVWLVDDAAAGDLPTRPVPDELFADSGA